MKIIFRWSSFDKSIPLEIQAQLRPDVILHFRGSDFQDTRSIGLDTKVIKKSGKGHCQILSGITKEQYQKVLQHVENYLEIPGLQTKITKDILVILLNTCEDHKLHIYSWAFHINHFSMQDLTPEFTELVSNAYI